MTKMKWMPELCLAATGMLWSITERSNKRNYSKSKVNTSRTWNDPSRNSSEMWLSLEKTTSSMDLWLKTLHLEKPLRDWDVLKMNIQWSSSSTRSISQEKTSLVFKTKNIPNWIKLKESLKCLRSSIISMPKSLTSFPSGEKDPGLTWLLNSLRRWKSKF